MIFLLYLAIRLVVTPYPKNIHDPLVCMEPRDKFELRTGIF